MGRGDWPEAEHVYRHKVMITSLAFSPDGRDLATGGDDGTAIVWNASNGGITHTLPTDHSTSLSSIAFSPDGKYLAAAGKVRSRTRFTAKSQSKPFFGVCKLTSRSALSRAMRPASTHWLSALTARTRDGV